MDIPLQIEPATDLELRGSTGRFSVSGPGGSSITVEYLLTYAGFSPSGQYSKLLNNITPVRELFDLNALDFDELLQRDLDDARISEELIPYILDPKSSSLVRLFPPIVALMLPYDPATRRPKRLYEKVTILDVPVPGAEHKLQLIQSGSTGSEAFRMERPRVNGSLLVHDQNRLLINTDKTCLAIVDGQHRAMALLALHRNLNSGWNDLRRAPYRDFYSHWTAEELGQFSLGNVSLPMMICFLPGLDEETEIDSDLIIAARSVFLALNKNARRVSVSRNRLLDDNDICAEYLRALLTEVKQLNVQIVDQPGGERLRLWNVELDQTKDRTQLGGEVAVTGVNHLYYIIEHLVLRNGNHVDISNRSGTYATRTVLTSHFSRIGAYDVLGNDVCGVTSRDSYSSDTSVELENLFMGRYGMRIIRLLSEVAPLQSLIEVFAELEEAIRDAHQSPELYQALFGSNGTSQAIAEHVGNMKRHVKEGDPLAQTSVAKEAISKLEAVTKAEKVRATQAREDAARDSLKAIGAGEPPIELVKAAVDWSRSWTTVAYQAALVATFFETIESVNVLLQDEGKELLSIDIEIDRYIDSVNAFLRPDSFEGLAKLVVVMRGATGGDTLESVFGPVGESSFRQVIGYSELQPDAWPSVRFLIMEVWMTATESLAEAIGLVRKHLRGQVFVRMYRRRLVEAARIAEVEPGDLPHAKSMEIFEDVLVTMQALVSSLSGDVLDASQMKMALAVGDPIAEPEGSE